MGTQQLLLLGVAVVIIGIAVTLGVASFGAESVASNRDAIVNDLRNLATDAVAFRRNGSFTGYIVPHRLRSNTDATYAPTTPNASATSVTFIATSAAGYGTITAVLDSTGKLGNFAYTGKF